MGLAAIPFAVDISEVKRVFGSKDGDLFEKIRTANLYNTYASQSDTYPFEEYNYNFDEALEDIIFRYKKPEDRKPKRSFFGLVNAKPTSGLNESIGHAYGYVLLVICDYLGKHLTPHCDGFYYGDDFKTATNIMKENGLEMDFECMFEHHDVFDLQISYDGPAMNHFTKAQIDHIVGVMEKVTIDESKASSDSENFDEVQMMLYDIRGSFRTCKEMGVEMVTFAH